MVRERKELVHNIFDLLEKTKASGVSLSSNTTGMLNHLISPSSSSVR